MTRADRWKKRKCVLEYWAFKDHVNYLKKGFELGNKISIVFCIPFPKSYSKKKCEKLFLKPHELKPDIDNLEKALTDAIKKKDQTIHNVRKWKVWSYKPAIFLINRA